jgi:hypothetical protein
MCTRIIIGALSIFCTHIWKQGRKCVLRLAGPNLELCVGARAALSKPSCLQTTSASLWSHSSSQTLPQLPLWKTSTLPARNIKNDWWKRCLNYRNIYLYYFSWKRVSNSLFGAAYFTWKLRIWSLFLDARAPKPIKRNPGQHGRKNSADCVPSRGARNSAGNPQALMENWHGAMVYVWSKITFSTVCAFQTPSRRGKQRSVYSSWAIWLLYYFLLAQNCQ